MLARGPAMMNTHSPCSMYPALVCCILTLLLPSLVTPCPTSRCPCTISDDSKQIIYCYGAGLSDVPTFTDDSLDYYELNLGDNDIQNLNANAFSELRIKRLDISNIYGPSIIGIATDAFTGLDDTLEELVLHVNQMNVFPVQALGSLTKLRKVEFRGFSMSSLPQNALVSFTQLEEARFLGCGLNTLTSSDFTSQASSLRLLGLDDNAFRSVPKDAVSSLQNLNTLLMKANQLSVLSASTFGNTPLRELDLSNNAISSFHTNTFQGVEDTLNILRIQHASLTDSRLPAFKVLTALQHLDMSFNDIVNFPTNFFSGMNQLARLLVESNDLRALSSSTFQGAEAALQELYLRGNQIRSIGSGTFSNFAALQTLELDSQSFGGSLNGNSFQGLENSLSSLSLTDVGFTSSNWPSVKNLKFLQSLKLTTNGITNISDFNFKDMTRLQILLLGSNSITSLSQRGFHGLQNTLQTLNMDKNSISTIGHCVLGDFTQLSAMDLHDNPLHCDCHLGWLREWLDKHYKPPYLDYVKWECASPQTHAGVYFRTVDLSCEPGNETPETCEDLSPTTTTVSTTTKTPTKPASTTTLGPPPQPLMINISASTETTLTVVWMEEGNKDITGFDVQYEDYPTGENHDSRTYGKDTSECTIDGLQPATKYLICVRMMRSGMKRVDEINSCDVGTTDITPVAVGEDSSRVAIILGAIFGVLGLIIVLAIVIFLIIRHRSKTQFPKTGGFPEHRQDVPRMGYDSKRFTKNRSMAGASATSTDLQNQANQDFQKKLESFSPDERDKILKLVSSSGASTLSMISNSSQRYILGDPRGPLPPKPGHEGYMNAVALGDLRDSYTDPDKSVYSEIPADEEYDEIPADDYI